MTIKQRTITVDCGDRKVVVRRMAWRAAKDFLRLLARHFSTLGPNVRAILADLPKVVAQVDELATHLVVNSSDLSAEDLDALDLVQATGVIAAACELNLGEDLKNSCAGIADNLAAVMPAWMKTKPTVSSTPSSSTPATPPNTSIAAPSGTSTSS